MLCWVSWHMQTGKKEEGSYSPDRQLKPVVKPVKVQLTER